MIMDPIVKNDIQILKKKGIIPFLIMAILTMNTPTVRAQSIETVIGDNALEFYPTHVMLPITDPNQGFNGEPQVLNIAVVVVVVVVAIVIIYYLVDFCQRKFPKTPLQKMIRYLRFRLVIHLVIPLRCQSPIVPMVHAGWMILLSSQLLNLNLFWFMSSRGW